jgi:hypothetical protein
MNTIRATAPSAAGGIILAIALSGLVAGTLDLIFAFLYYPVSVQRVLQSVAAGAIGREAAIGGGWETAALGAACHYFISLCAAAAYVIASRALPMLVRQPLIWGPAFGIAMYFFMNAILVPMSAAGRPLNWAFVTDWVPLLAHMFLFGLPIAWIARYFTYGR